MLRHKEHIPNHHSNSNIASQPWQGQKLGKAGWESIKKKKLKCQQLLKETLKSAESAQYVESLA